MEMLTSGLNIVRDYIQIWICGGDIQIRYLFDIYPKTPFLLCSLGD